MITERLLQFIWQFQYFNKTDLQLHSGESVQILFPGYLNTNQGPDFLEAKIKIDNTIWAGNIELHLNEADWNAHAHGKDPNYKNIILHVVWQYNGRLVELPTLTLMDKVPKLLLSRYEKLMNSKTFVPCAGSLKKVKEITWIKWKERLLAERLLRKADMIKKHLQESQQHWEEVFWWMIARNFGITVNQEAFEAIAKSISINILAKHKNQIHQLEALLLGQAGLLNEEFAEDYPKLLQKEYQFLQKKYKLLPIHQPVYFLRMRPQNFPTVRLAQLAMLIHRSSHLFSHIKELQQAADVTTLFNLTANDYWHYHYVLDQPADFKPKTLGKQTIQNILINTIAPVLFVYGDMYQEDQYKTKALQWLERIDGENNAITAAWKTLGISNKSAYDSQSLIELKKQYCDEKRCLECAIGNSLLKSE